MTPDAADRIVNRIIDELLTSKTMGDAWELLSLSYQKAMARDFRVIVLDEANREAEEPT